MSKKYRMAYRLIFFIDDPGDPLVGINPLSETITITVDSGDPGGNPGEFQEHMREALKEWYPEANLRTEEEEMED